MNNKTEVKILGILVSLFLGLLLIPLWAFALRLPFNGLADKILMADILGLLSVDWFILIGLFSMAIIFICRGKQKKIHMTFVNIIMLILWILFEKNALGSTDVFETMLFCLSIVVLGDLIYSVIFIFKSAYQISGPEPRM